MRCLRCGREDLAGGTTRCPACQANLAALLYDVLPAGRELHDSKYRIAYAIGKGGFGITYKAELSATGGSVAIKEYCPQGIAPRDPVSGSITVSLHDLPNFDRGLAIFRREAQILENVTHPNVVRIRDFFDENNTSYLVMEYLNGPTLRNIMRDALPKEERVREIMGGLVSALGTLHEKGIYHLDIKPGNIILEPERGAVLVDFGAARQGTTLSDMSSLPQTKAYAPLEMIRPERGMDDAYGPETDLYELGVTLYEMLTGQLPPPADARAVGQAWDISDLSDPWRTLIKEATRLERTERPRDVRSWWALAEGASTLPESPSSPTSGNVAKYGDIPSANSWASYQPKSSADTPVAFPASQDFARSGVPSQDSGNLSTGNTPSQPSTPPPTDNGRSRPLVALGALAVAVAATIGFLTVLNSQTPQPSPTPVVVVVSPTPATPSPEPTVEPTTAPDSGLSDAERKQNTQKLIQALNRMGEVEASEDYIAFMDKLSLEVEVLVRRGADVKVKGSKGQTVLHLATYKDNVALAETCLERGADPNVANADLYTPLHMAALAPAPEVAKLLVKAGAKKGALTPAGESPLVLARTVQESETDDNFRQKRAALIRFLESLR